MRRKPIGTRTITRKIGRWGTAGRLLVGALMIAAAWLLGVDAIDLLVGLVAIPLIVVGVVALRGITATPIRFTGTNGNCVNCAVGAAALVFVPVPALLFLGASMVLAAVRGYAGCELFAISNWILRRDDQIACPIFGAVDRIEAAARERR